MSAVFKREFRSLFNCMRGYAVLSVLLLSALALVVYYGFLLETPDLSYVLSDLMLLSALLCPILTLKLFSASDRLLCSLPISPTEALFGKYLSVMSVYAIQAALLALVPFIYNYFTKVNFAAAYISLLAYFLFSASVAAVCMFFAAVSKKPSVMLGASYGYVILMYVLQVISYFVEKQDMLLGIPARVMNFLGIFNRFELFVYGTFDVGAVVYYLSLCIFFLCLSLRGFERKLGGETV